jgi:mono/diheme cytochrome c family protein
VNCNWSVARYNKRIKLTCLVGKPVLKRLVIWLVLLLAVVACGWAVLTPGLAPVLVNVNEPPRLQIAPLKQSIGTVITDSKVKAAFTLTNTGGKILVIKGVEPSCGCTAADLPKTRLRPGESMPLGITLDTSIKLGDVVKTIDIWSNDPVKPMQVATLTGTVIFQMKGHQPIKVKDPLVLFKGECATCHVDKGRGKTGKALFVADCAMCHGSRGQGAVAPSLMAQDWSQAKTVQLMRRIVAEGSPQSPEMPPYHQSKGGPLTDAEIDSIITYLTFEYQEQKAKPQ